MAMAFGPDDERAHPGLIDEWVFATWTPDGAFGVVSGHRLLGPVSWYWCAVVEKDQPLLHLTEWEVVVRSFDPHIIKAPEMWAEHQLDAPMEQWSLGNEAYFVALDDPDEAHRRRLRWILSGMRPPTRTRSMTDTSKQVWCTAPSSDCIDQTSNSSRCLLTGGGAGVPRSDRWLCRLHRPAGRTFGHPFVFQTQPRSTGI